MISSCTRLCSSSSSWLDELWTEERRQLSQPNPLSCSPSHSLSLSFSPSPFLSLSVSLSLSLFIFLFLPFFVASLSDVASRQETASVGMPAGTLGIRVSLQHLPLARNLCSQSLGCFTAAVIFMCEQTKLSRKIWHFDDSQKNALRSKQIHVSRSVFTNE